MAKGVYAALSGAVGASVALDVTAQNLANATTAGYQRLRPIFREVLAEQQRRPGQPPAPPAPAANHYSAAQGTVIDLTPGVTRSTGRALDVALPESTFLAVRTGAGERYTRAGSISRTPTGALRLADAELVDEGGKPIVVDPSADVAATPDGRILADGTAVARLRLVRFDQAALLRPESGSLYAASPESGEAQAATGELLVGSLEDSNASPVNAMTELISVSRMFEAYQRAMETFREADRKIVTVPQT